MSISMSINPGVGRTAVVPAGRTDRSGGRCVTTTQLPDDVAHDEAG
jgi:hypothetical protein